MAIDGTRFKEFMALMEEVQELKAEAKDAASAYREKIKSATQTLTSWAENNQFEKSTVNNVMKLYAGYREGTVKWKDGEDEVFISLLSDVIDEAIK
jgi:hypothetical protein